MVELVKIAELTREQIASICDHTFLRTSEYFIEKAKKWKKSEDFSYNLREKAFKKFLKDTCEMDVVPYGVCVYPGDVSTAKNYLANHGREQIKIASVVGFPRGDCYSTYEKCKETKWAIKDGADEIDMVMDFGTMRVLGDLTGSISEDIWNVVYEASEGNKKERIVKVIFENSELNSDPNLIKEACEACTEAGAHFVKTSTGFGKYGARAKDLKIMRDNFAGGVKMAGRVNPKNLRKLLRAASGRNDGYIELDPMKIRIGESSLLDKLDNMGVGEVGGEGKY